MTQTWRTAARCFGARTTAFVVAAMFVVVCGCSSLVGITNLTDAPGGAVDAASSIDGRPDLATDGASTIAEGVDGVAPDANTSGAAGATGFAGTIGSGGATGSAGSTMGAAGQTGGAGGPGTAGMAGAGGNVANGTAGTAGTAGLGGVTGAGGTGGMKVVTGACANKVHAAAAVIDTFENGSLTSWYEYKDSTPGATLNPLAIVSPGAAATTKSLRLSGRGFQGFGAGVGLMSLCTDASAFRGITFWAKGTSGTDNNIALQVAIPATQAVADGGDCTSSCYDHPSKKVVLTSAWQQYQVLFTDLGQAGFGPPAEYGGIIMALNWVSIEGPTVDFEIDEIEYY